jgi:hypothetical protein
MKAEQDKINKSIKFYLTEDDRNILIAAAEKDQRNLSGLIRKILKDWIIENGKGEK